MHGRILIYTASGFAAAALLAWGAFAGALLLLSHERAAYAEAHAAADQSSERSAAAALLHVLVRDTTADRQKLESFFESDILEEVRVIESVGDSVGVPLKISNATSPDEEKKKGKSVVQTITLDVAAEGTFSKLMHASELLQSLPFPSDVLELSLERVPESAANSGPWALHARVALTAAADSSL